MSSIDGINSSRVPSLGSNTASKERGFAHAFSTAFRKQVGAIFDRGVDADIDTSTDTSMSDAIRGSIGASLDQRYGMFQSRAARSMERLETLNSKLTSEYQLAALLPSTSTGTWDPRSFVPASSEQAAAFAQRMAIDTTTAAARLDVIKSELDAARVQVQKSGSSEAKQKEQTLSSEFDRQVAYLGELAKVVDRASGGEITQEGKNALAGDTSRGKDDLLVGELAQELSRRGIDVSSIARALGAGEVAIDEADKPEGSETLKRVVSKSTEYFQAQILQVKSNAAEQDREFERVRAIKNRNFEQALEKKRVQVAEQDRIVEQKRVNVQQTQATNKAYRDEQLRQKESSEFAAWVRRLEQQEVSGLTQRITG